MAAFISDYSTWPLRPLSPLHVSHLLLSPCHSHPLQFIASVVGIVDHPSAPRLPDSVREGVAPPHKPWCHLTWSHVIPTLRYWLALFDDLQVGVTDCLLSRV